VFCSAKVKVLFCIKNMVSSICELVFVLYRENCLFCSPKNAYNWEISGPISAEAFILPSASVVLLSDTLLSRLFYTLLKKPCALCVYLTSGP